MIEALNLPERTTFSTYLTSGGIFYIIQRYLEYLCKNRAITGYTAMVSTELQSLEKFREVNQDFPKTGEIPDLKQQGKIIFGWLCTYVPEEILPVRITGYSQETELDDGKIQYGYNDATGDYYITIDSGKYNGFGKCETACPATIFEMISGNGREPKAGVTKAARKRLSILCPGNNACSNANQVNCLSTCPTNVISLSW